MVRIGFNPGLSDWGPYMSLTWRTPHWSSRWMLPLQGVFFMVANSQTQLWTLFSGLHLFVCLIYFIYLAASGLNCDTWNLCGIIQNLLLGCTKWDLSPLNRDWTRVPCILKLWTTTEVPLLSSFNSLSDASILWSWCPFSQEKTHFAEGTVLFL